MTFGFDLTREQANHVDSLTQGHEDLDLAGRGLRWRVVHLVGTVVAGAPGEDSSDDQLNPSYEQGCADAADRALTANGFTRSGFNFTEWNTTTSGTGTRYDDGGTYPFSRSGYTFTRWATTAAGPGVDYVDGAAFRFSSNTTLYAQWQATPVTQPVPTTPAPSTTVAPSTSTPVTTTPAPVPVVTPAGELPTLAPGNGLLLEGGVEIPVEVTVEQDAEVVLRTRENDFELRLAGDCDTGCTLVDDGTYSGDFALEGVPVGHHTVQANGISNDDLSRSANLGVVVQAGDVTPSGNLPATGSQPWPLTLGAVLAVAVGVVTLARMKRVTPTRPR